MTITCNVCGYDQNPDGLEFCDACGAELAVSNIPAPTIKSDPEPSPTIVNNHDNQPLPDHDLLPDNDLLPEPNTAPEAPNIEQGTAKLVSKLPNSPIDQFLVDNFAVIGIFDPDTGPVDIDLEEFSGSETVSRQHGEIYLEDGQWKIKDLGSTNGIFIKKAGENRFNARITSPEVINNGDEIAIAKIRFTFTTT